MKLSISNKTESIDNGMSIQDKVNKIMGIETTNKGKESNNMKLSISNKTESIKPKKLELKINKGINQDNLDLSINKFNQVESILKKLDSIDNTFINFLNNQNSAIEIINSFDKRIDTIELITTNLIKNQKSILDSINSLHANLFQDNKKESKQIETKSNDNKVITRKKLESKEVDTNSIDGIFDIFQDIWGNKNFLGNKKLTPETMPIFQALIESIEIDSIDTIQESINKFRSKLLKDTGKYMTARKSNKNFDSAIIKTIEKINGKSYSITESKQNDSVIDKNYFADLFKVKETIITDLINEAIDYGKVDSALMESISNYFNNPSITDNMIGKFAKYIKAYMQAISD